MIIENAKKHHVPLFTPMAQMFYDEFSPPGGVDKDRFQANWENWMDAGFAVACVLMDGEKCVGAVGGLMVEAANDGELEANEMFWYVMPDYRKSGMGMRLLERWEDACRMRGAKRISMISLVAGAHGRQVARWLEQRGYRPVEIHYYRDLES